MTMQVEPVAPRPNRAPSPQEGRPAACSAAAVGKADARRPVVRRDGDSIVIDIPMTFRRRGKR